MTSLPDTSTVSPAHSTDYVSEGHQSAYPLWTIALLDLMGALLFSLYPASFASWPFNIALCYGSSHIPVNQACFAFRNSYTILYSLTEMNITSHYLYTVLVDFFFVKQEAMQYILSSNIGKVLHVWHPHIQEEQNNVFWAVILIMFMLC